MSLPGNSLPFRWLPEFNLVALWVHDPTKLAVLGVIRLFEHVAALFAQRLKQGGQVINAVVDHEGRGAWCKVIAARSADRPDGCPLRGIARVIRPSERCATPFLHVDAEMLPVPSVQPFGVSRLKEDSSDTCDSLHLNLRAVTENGA